MRHRCGAGVAVPLTLAPLGLLAGAGAGCTPVSTGGAHRHRCLPAHPPLRRGDVRRPGALSRARARRIHAEDGRRVARPGHLARQVRCAAIGVGPRCGELLLLPDLQCRRVGRDRDLTSGAAVIVSSRRPLARRVRPRRCGRVGRREVVQSHPQRARRERRRPADEGDRAEGRAAVGEGDRAARRGGGCGAMAAPVGATAATVAVRVTVAPWMAGAGATASVVVVAIVTTAMPACVPAMVAVAVSAAVRPSAPPCRRRR